MVLIVGPTSQPLHSPRPACGEQWTTPVLGDAKTLLQVNTIWMGSNMAARLGDGAQMPGWVAASTDEPEGPAVAMSTPRSARLATVGRRYSKFSSGPVGIRPAYPRGVDMQNPK